MLKDEHCTDRPPRLDPNATAELGRQTPDWRPAADTLEREFAFRNFHETMGFANAVAFMANREDHHPDMELSYKRCVLRFTTHSAGGLSRNDFVMAAKVDALWA